MPSNYDRFDVIYRFLLALEDFSVETFEKLVNFLGIQCHFESVLHDNKDGYSSAHDVTVNFAKAIQSYPMDTSTLASFERGVKEHFASAQCGEPL